MILAMNGNSKQRFSTPLRFIEEQEKIQAKYPSLLDKKDWLFYMGSIRNKASLAVEYMDQLDHAMTEDSELSFHVVEARIQAIETHRMASALQATGVFRRVTSLSAKGEQLRGQYDILKELIQHVFVLLGKADEVARISRAM